MSDEKTLSKAAQVILEAVEKLTVLELADLVKAMEEKFGVSAAAPMAMAGAPAAASAAVEEKTSFNIELAEAGGQKIAVIKVLREITGLGLKEAKDLTDGAPKIVKENVPKEEAEKMKKSLEAAGAKVNLK